MTTKAELHPCREQFGFVYGMSFEDYAAVDALNASSLVNLRRSPLYYRHCKDNPQAETAPMRLGTACHKYILEPERSDEFAVWGIMPDEKVRNGRVWEAFKAANSNRHVVTLDEWVHITRMGDAVHSQPSAHKYAAVVGKTEVSMFWIDKATGRKLKARMDKVCSATHTILDLKTTRSCQPYKFGSQAYALAYHIRAYIYCSGYEAITGNKAKFKWLAVEYKPPYECAVYRATPDVLTQGAEDLDVLMKLLFDCEQSGTWPAEMGEESDLLLPTYAYTSSDELIFDEEED